MSPTPRLNRRQLAKAATRTKVMDAARRLWAEPGSYEAGDIRSIAKAAGMSTGAVFANFDSKADLWRAVMGYEPPVDCAAVREALQSAPTAKLVAALKLDAELKAAA